MSGCEGRQGHALPLTAHQPRHTGPAHWPLGGQGEQTGPSPPHSTGFSLTPSPRHSSTPSHTLLTPFTLRFTLSFTPHLYSSSSFQYTSCSHPHHFTPSHTLTHQPLASAGATPKIHVPSGRPSSVSLWTHQ